jgi:two-component system, LuxR family, response regulator FixJ
LASVNKKNIFLVDDDAILLKAVKETLESITARISCFTSAVECLEQLGKKKCDLLITDLKMPKMDGLELVIRAGQQAPWLPVLVVTGYGDIPTAIKAIKAGAVDFIQKPLDRKSLLKKVQSLLQENSNLFGKELSRMELKVLKHVMDGKSSKEIANLLNRSSRTIEFHRSNIMIKFGVDNIVNLIKRVVSMKLVVPQEQQDRSKTIPKEEQIE